MKREAMKTTFAMLGVCGTISVLAAQVAQANDENQTAASTNDVTLYQVSWRCPAAPHIGCGSHAKPILLELEKNPSVSQAWLNRQGTVVAVVWNPEVTTKARRGVEKALKEQKASRLKGNARTKALADFNSGEGWYRGGQVDRLSEEEAGVIAARWIHRVQAKTTVAPDKADGLQHALAESIATCLTGKDAIPESNEQRGLALRRIASPYLDEAQVGILIEAATRGFRAMPGED